MSALGCNGVAVDWTNYTSYRLETPGQDWYKYTYGVYANTEVLLKEASSSLGFESPKIYITVRLSGENYDALMAKGTPVGSKYIFGGNEIVIYPDGSARATRSSLFTTTIAKALRSWQITPSRSRSVRTWRTFCWVWTSSCLLRPSL